MKNKSLLLGILLGGLAGFGIAKYFTEENPQINLTETIETADSSVSEKWSWAYSLDALKAAPDNHKVVYEDDNVRVLAVLLDGKKSEPVHTHKWKSVMWIAKPVVPFTVYVFKLIWTFLFKSLRRV